MSINDLIKAKSEQRLALSNQANKLIPEQRSMTPEENSQFDAIHADADKLNDEISRLQKQLKLENDMGTPRSNGIQIGNVRTSFDGDEMDQKKALKAWREYLDHGSATGELRANVEYSNIQKRDYTTGGTTGGGYLAPTISAVGFNEILVDYLDIRQAPLGKFETFGGNLTNYPNWNYNGSSAARTAEGATVGTDTSAVAGNTQFSAFNYDSQLIPLSIQFIQDNVLPIDQIINKEIGKRLGLSINWDFTNGSGSGAPQGITVGAGASGTTLSTTGLGSSTTVAYQNLVDIIYSIPSPYRNRKSTGWMMHPKTFAAVRKLVDSNGRPLYAIGGVTNGISDGPASTLLDYPVYLNTAVPQLATGNKSLIFGDFNCYVYRDIQNSYAVMRLTELLAQKREVGYLGFYRTDGRVVDNVGLVYAANA